MSKLYQFFKLREAGLSKVYSDELIADIRSNPEQLGSNCHECGHRISKIPNKRGGVVCIQGKEIAYFFRVCRKCSATRKPDPELQPLGSSLSCLNSGVFPRSVRMGLGLGIRQALKDAAKETGGSA